MQVWGLLAKSNHLPQVKRSSSHRSVCPKTCFSGVSLMISSWDFSGDNIKSPFWERHAPMQALFTICIQCCTPLPRRLSHSPREPHPMKRRRYSIVQVFLGCMLGTFETDDFCRVPPLGLFQPFTIAKSPLSHRAKQASMGWAVAGSLELGFNWGRPLFSRAKKWFITREEKSNKRISGKPERPFPENQRPR